MQDEGGTEGRRRSPAGGPVRIPALAPLRVKAYRQVWSAQAVSQVGTYLQLTAAPWLMLQMTGSPLYVSLVTTALFLPRLLFTLPAGTLADRVDRRALMVVGNGISAGAVGVLAVIVHLDRLTPLSLLVFTFALGVGSAVGKPSHQTLVPDLVPAPLRAQAITLNSATAQTARIVGPSIGGLFVALGLAELAFAGNAVSFLLIILVLLRLPRGAGGDSGARPAGGAFRATADGIRFVRSHRGLRALLLVTAAFTMTSASVQALLPNVVADDLSGGASAFGILYGVFGAGALIATLTRERAAALAGRRMLPGAVGVFGLAAVAFGSAPGLISAGVSLAVVGIAWVWTMTTLNATVQLLAPRWVRGRVVSLYVVAAAMKPLGALLAGALAEITGAGVAVVMTSLATLALALVVIRARLPVLGDLDAWMATPPPPHVHAPADVRERRLDPRLKQGPIMPHDPVALADRTVPPLGLGCMSMSHPGRSDDVSIRVLRAAFDGGVRLFDTADRYGRGHNEELVARALGGVRDEVVIATKVGFVGAPGRDARPVDASPEHIVAACDESLARLGTDRIDLLHLHRVDPEVPIEESVGAMAVLVAEGKVARLGLSEVSAEALARAQRVHPIAAVQSEYSLWSRDVEAAVLPACRSTGVAFVAYSPLGVGFLTGRYRRPDQLPAGNRLAGQPRMQERNLDRNLALLERLEGLAEGLGGTPAQLALAWVLRQSVIAIPGSSQEEHLRENLVAATLVVDDETTRVLDEAFAPDRIAGARKSAAALALTER